MSELDLDPIKKAVQLLKSGDVIAYPTESVYGFGCDPFNPDAVAKLLQLKNREIKKGFILVATEWEQVEHLVAQVSPMLLSQIQNSWPGPTTWIFPVDPSVPEWICGNNGNIAIRISDHPIIRDICNAFDGPIISTSANTKGNIPTRDYFTTKMLFQNDVAFIVEGKTGGLRKPTTIKDAITGDILRE